MKSKIEILERRYVRVVEDIEMDDGEAGFKIFADITYSFGGKIKEGHVSVKIYRCTGNCDVTEAKRIIERKLIDSIEDHELRNNQVETINKACVDLFQEGHSDPNCQCKYCGWKREQNPIKDPAISRLDKI